MLAGNGQNGVQLFASAASISGIQIVGNLIGLGPNGTSARGNGGFGVNLVTSGGFAINNALIDRNVVSSNGQGIVVGIGSTGTQITGNIVGLNSAGTASMPGSGLGINILGANTVIGGATSAASNVIAGNAAGILLHAGATGSQVLGNFIGTNAAGAGALGNVGIAIEIFEASGNAIGGTVAGAGNTIAFNGTNGVQVTSGTDNAIRGNTIHSNGGRGIDLGGGRRHCE